MATIRQVYAVAVELRNEMEVAAVAGLGWDREIGPDFPNAEARAQAIAAELVGMVGLKVAPAEPDIKIKKEAAGSVEGGKAGGDGELADDLKFLLGRLEMMATGLLLLGEAERLAQSEGYRRAIREAAGQRLVEAQDMVRGLLMGMGASGR